jgi:hypothetical protein
VTTADLLPPADLSGITPDWLSAALSQRHPGTVVEAVTAGEAVHGTGTNLPLRLRYARQPASGSLPERMWLKGGYEAHFAAMAPSRIYEIEPAFYRELAPRLAMRVPRCYYAGSDPASHQGLVLLEDLAAAGARFGKATQPVSPDVAAAALAALARLHASSWGQDWPQALWYVEQGIPLAGPNASWYRAQTPEVFARYLAQRAEAAVPASIQDARRIVRAFWTLAEQSRDGVRCLIHSDCHLDNFYFERDGAPGLMDWQSPRLGSWAWDVSYFIVSALEIGTRREYERELLAHYLEALAGQGIAAPTPDQAWLAYRQYNAYGLFVKIVNPDIFKPREINLAWMSRHVAAAEDLETFESLGV